MLRQCITCYACNEICPRKANPFDLIAALQEKYDVFSSKEAAAAQEARLRLHQTSDGLSPGREGDDRVRSSRRRTPI